MDEKELITRVALRANFLSNAIYKYTDLPDNSGFSDEENQTINAINLLKRIIEEHHDPNLRDKKYFSDFVSQVLVFSLLYSRLIVIDCEDTPSARYQKIMEYWSSLHNGTYINRKLGPFKAIFDILKNEINSSNQIGVWYKDTAKMLSYVDISREDLSLVDYHSLFEAFLKKFNPKIKFDFGAYYTPKYLANFMVKLIDKIIKDEFPDF